MKTAGLFCIMLFTIALRATPDVVEYTVAENDTLWSISQRYSISVDALKAVNNIDNEKMLRVGMTLLIPSVYIVEKGDNLWRIARKHQTSVQVIRELNDMDDDRIHVGEILIVPQIKPESAAAEKANEIPGDDNTVPPGGSGEIAPAGGPEDFADFPFWPVEGIKTAKSGKISGMEILGSQGDTVFSIAGGEVVWNASSPVFGKVIIIESASNYLYLYSGLAETVVTYGEKISAGTKIAELGVNPHTGEARLLFSVYKDGKLVDPALAPRG